MSVDLRINYAERKSLCVKPITNGCVAPSFINTLELNTVYMFLFNCTLHLHNIDLNTYVKTISVADPGFPVGGGVDLVGWAVDPRGSYVSKILHVKMKKSGPVGGGGGARRARPPRSANGFRRTF